MKKILLFSAFLVTMVSSNVFAEGDGDPTKPTSPGDRGNGDGGTSCTVTSNCYLADGRVDGSVSCTGKICQRTYGLVVCDGVITSCNP